MSSVINETLLAIKAAFEAGVNIFNGGTAVSSSNPLPVAETDGLAVSGTATSAAVLFTTSMLNYGMIIGASPPDGAMTGFFDNFIVYKYD